jgi:hypothetical protein
MSSRWKKVWADFWRNKSRAILAILTIGVGVFTVGFSSNTGPTHGRKHGERFLSPIHLKQWSMLSQWMMTA